MKSWKHKVPGKYLKSSKQLWWTSCHTRRRPLLTNVTRSLTGARGSAPAECVRVISTCWILGWQVRWRQTSHLPQMLWRNKWEIWISHAGVIRVVVVVRSGSAVWTPYYVTGSRGIAMIVGLQQAVVRCWWRGQERGVRRVDVLWLDHAAVGTAAVAVRSWSNVLRQFWCILGRGCWRYRLRGLCEGRFPDAGRVLTSNGV